MVIMVMMVQIWGAQGPSLLAPFCSRDELLHLISEQHIKNHISSSYHFIISLIKLSHISHVTHQLQVVTLALALALVTLFSLRAPVEDWWIALCLHGCSHTIPHTNFLLFLLIFSKTFVENMPQTFSWAFLVNFLSPLFVMIVVVDLVYVLWYLAKTEATP